MYSVKPYMNMLLLKKWKHFELPNQYSNKDKPTYLRLDHRPEGVSTRLVSSLDLFIKQYEL